MTKNMTGSEQSPTLDNILAGPSCAAGLVAALSRRFGPRRRDFLVGTAVAGSALATNPKSYALRPGSALASICGPGSGPGSGWTVFCCTINGGVNACPPGSFAAGWWKAADSSWCGGGYRYIVDCNATCKCGCGSDSYTHLCSRSCWSCKCNRSGRSGTCDQRRSCCNAFRYGQCNTHIKCSGGVHCRVVSCVPPYRWASCTTTTLIDNNTGEHNAPCLPSWGPIQKKYDTMGAQRSFLKGSTGPIHLVGDGRGKYVTYQHGAIYWSAKTGAHAMVSAWLAAFKAAGSTKNLGYPTADWRRNLPHQGSILTFEKGALVDSTETPLSAVIGGIYTAWLRAGRESGVLGYPVGKAAKASRGQFQAFQHGEIWQLTGATARFVYGPVLAKWKADGAGTGTWGYPTTDTTRAKDGTYSCRFEKGTITTK